MQLFHRASTNYDRVPPWDETVYWIFEITFNWKTFLLGFSIYDGVYAVNIGGFAIMFFYNWNAR